MFEGMAIGVLDKNGRELKEGDVIKLLYVCGEGVHPVEGEIRYDKSLAQFVVETTRCTYPLAQFLVDETVFEYMDVKNKNFI